MKLSNVAFTGSINISGSLILPNGTANLRPSNPQTGSLFVETSSSGSNLLVYNGQSGSGWEIAGIQTEPKLYTPPPNGDIEYLVIAGGGSGGAGSAGSGGGGGAGGYLSSSLSSIESGSSITVTVGAGAAAGGTIFVSGIAGTDSSIASAGGTSFTTVTATGGGEGGYSTSDTAGDGGSGGGGSTNNGSFGTGGSGTVGQGNDGGDGASLTILQWAAGGGGGAGAVGEAAEGNNNAGEGGDGSASNITGASTTRAGGGGGGAWASGGGTGGTGGGGTGGSGTNEGSAATSNTGGGGGGGGQDRKGGAGGSGVAILAYNSGSITATGGVAKSRSDGHVYHTFNSSGTLTVGGPNDGSILNGDNFGAITYVGDRPTNAAKTGMGFQADLIIIKGRSFSDHWSVLDSSRGANVLGTNQTDAQASFSGFTFDTDGFTVGSSGQANSDGETHIAWGWKATGGTTTSNSNGTITSAVQANTAAGFSIVTYTGDGNNGTVGHGLDSAPEIVITKATSRTSNWSVSGTVAGLIPGTNKLRLNDTAAISSDSNEVLAISSTTFTAGASSAVGMNNENFVAYCFHSVAGYQKFGSYSGTGSSLEVTVGFQPRFVVVKRVDSGDRWLVVDSFRGGATNNDNFLDFQDTLSERDMNATNGLTFNSNSFTVNTTDGALNNSSGTYFYWAIA